MIAAAPAKPTKIIKYVCRLSIVIPKNTGRGPVASGSGYSELMVPANLFPVAMAKNQMPIINDVKRPGVNLFTMDKPIGLKNNSPTVCKKYKTVNHNILTFKDGSAEVPKDINKKPKARKPRPIACFIGAGGSMPRRPNLPQRPAKMGANSTIKIGLK